MPRPTIPVNLVRPSHTPPNRAACRFCDVPEGHVHHRECAYRRGFFRTGDGEIITLDEALALRLQGEALMEHFSND